MSGLLGMARAAGRARGQYMAAEQEYNRARQAQQDAMRQEEFLRGRQRFHNELADRETRNAQDAERFRWAQQNQQNALADRETRNQRADTMFGWAQQNQKNALEDRERKVAAFKIGQERANKAYGMRERALAEVMKTDPTAVLHVDDDLSAKGGYNFMTQQQREAQAKAQAEALAQKQQVQAATNNQKQRNEIAQQVTPEYMAAFMKQEYDVTDDELKKAGLTREQFLQMAAQQYKSHLLQGSNESPEDFMYKFGKQYGLRSNYDMAPVAKTRADDRGFAGRELTNEEYLNPKRYDGWIYDAPGYKAQKANPSRYRMQNMMFNDMSGLNSEQWQILHGNVDAARKYHQARAKGKSQDEAYNYAIGKKEEPADLEKEKKEAEQKKREEADRQAWQAKWRNNWPSKDPAQVAKYKKTFEEMASQGIPERQAKQYSILYHYYLNEGADEDLARNRALEESKRALRPSLPAFGKSDRRQTPVQAKAETEEEWERRKWDNVMTHKGRAAHEKTYNEMVSSGMGKKQAKEYALTYHRYMAMGADDAFARKKAMDESKDYIKIYGSK